MRAASDLKVSAAAGGRIDGVVVDAEDSTPPAPTRNRNDRQLAVRIRCRLRDCSPHIFHAYAAVLEAVQCERGQQ